MRRHLFNHTIEINVDLGQLDLESIINLPLAGKQDYTDRYISGILNKNHLIISRDGKHQYERYHHVVTYDDSLITIKSSYQSFLAYSLFLLPMVLLYLSFRIGFDWPFTLITFGSTIFFTLVLSLGIKYESKEVEREIIIRINYHRSGRAQQIKAYKRPE